MFLNLSQLNDRVEELARVIAAPKETLPTFGYSEQSGRPHVEVDANGYHYVAAERGHEHSRQTTSDIDELLYAVFQDVTFVLACKYELNHRMTGQDFRRIMFAHQEDLLSRLNQSWGERGRLEHTHILEQYPFDD